jgi:hypothetical protein
VAIANVRRWVAAVALGAAVAFLAWKLVRFESTGLLALDFKLSAAQRLVEGGSLYPADASGQYPYPPLWAMLASPLLLLPHSVGQYVAAILCAGAVLAALRVIGVRDPLCMALALVSTSVVSTAQMANISAFVALLAALTYRYSGAPAGVATALKLYPGPLLVWSGMRRGPRDLFIAVSVAVTGIVLPWAIIGFEGIARYPRVAHEITARTAVEAHALPTMLGIAVALLALTAMWVRRADAAGSFAFAVMAMLAWTPVLWGFYFTAVLVPLGIRRPQFSIAWLIPFFAVAAHGHVHVALMFGLLAWCAIGAPSPSLSRLKARLPAEPVI